MVLGHGRTGDDVTDRHSRHTYEEGQDCRRIEAETKGLDPEESDTGRRTKLTAGHIVLAPVAGDDCSHHVAQKQGDDHLQHKHTHEMHTCSSMGNEVYCVYTV